MTARLIGVAVLCALLAACGADGVPLRPESDAKIDEGVLRPSQDEFLDTSP